MALPVSPELPSPWLDRPHRAHAVGLCGAGMTSLAEFLHDRQWELTGSDAAPPPDARARFEARGIPLTEGHAPENLPREAELLIYSPAVPESNPERMAATARQLPQLSAVELLAEAMRRQVGISIVGTHGKSTTTAMLGTIFREAGRDPSLYCGAELVGYEASGWSGAGKEFIAESCEYRSHFLQLQPQHACLLGIEPDHFDCFPTLQDATEAYREFLAQIPSGGLVIYNRDPATSHSAVGDVRGQRVSFSISGQADWTIRQVQRTPEGRSFDVDCRGFRFGTFELPIPGRHHLINALAAIALSAELGLSPDAIRRGLLAFRGIRRRFERIGPGTEQILIDDYAHHPTAVEATLQTAREEFPGRTITCLFQPHQTLRLKHLLEEFVESLSAADEVIIVPVYAAREDSPESTLYVEKLVSGLQSRGVAARFSPSLDHLSRSLETIARPKGVYLTIGAGDIYRVHYELLRKLQRDRAS